MEKLPSALHCMNVVHSSGSGYKQSLTPLHPVAAMSSSGQTKVDCAPVRAAKMNSIREGVIVRSILLIDSGVWTVMLCKLAIFNGTDSAIMYRLQLGQRYGSLYGLPKKL